MSTVPIPSLDIDDFKANIQDFDAMANGTGVYTDRFGKERLTLDAFMAANGFEVPVAFASGIAVSRTTQTVTYNGNTYHALPSALPFTTTGTFNAAQWVLLRQNADNVTSATLTITGFTASALLDGAWIHFAGRDTVGDGGGGMFRYSASSTQAADGVFVFAPTGGGRLLRDGWTVLGFNGTVCPEMAGARGGVVDDTAAVQSAITAMAVSGGGTLRFSAKPYTLSGKVLVVSNMSIDLGGATIAGSMSSTMFESGYLSGSTIVTNIGTANESHILTNCSIRGGTIKSSLLAFNVFNFTSNCEVSDIVFNDCRQNFQAVRSFYSRWRNLLARPTAANIYAGVPSFVLYDNNNAMLLEGVYVTDRDYAGLIHGASFQLTITDCGAENCRAGFVFENETFALNITHCYFETMSGACLDFTYSAQNTGTNIDCNWFHNAATAITGQLMIGGSIGPSNVYSGVTSKVVISDDNYSSIVVYAPSNDGGGNAAPGLSTGFTLGKKVQVVGFGNIYNASTGVPQISTASAPKLIPFNLYGDAGAVTVNQIPYCTHASSGGANFNIQVTTGITYQEKTTFLAFRFTVSDNVGTYDVYGMVFGDIVKQFDTSGKTVTISANGGGNIVLSIGVMNNPSSAYSITGMVRHV